MKANLIQSRKLAVCRYVVPLPRSHRTLKRFSTFSYLHYTFLFWESFSVIFSNSKSFWMRRAWLASFSLVSCLFASVLFTDLTAVQTHSYGTVCNRVTGLGFFLVVVVSTDPGCMACDVSHKRIFSQGFQSFRSCCMFVTIIKTFQHSFERLYDFCCIVKIPSI